MARADGRGPAETRRVEIVPGYLSFAAGSALIHVGETRVLCTASVEERVPPFLVGTGQGWITSEYAMIPGSTRQRSQRESTRGRPGGRTLEIQRLIGRVLRAAVDRRALGDRTVWVDCEVLQADGGTRTASVTGGFVALCLALDRLREQELLKAPPLAAQVAAVSVGMVHGEPVLDLDYAEDSAAEVDMNVVRTDDGRYVELQGTAEGAPFPRAGLEQLLALADVGIDRLLALQGEVLGPALARLRARR